MALVTLITGLGEVPSIITFLEGVWNSFFELWIGTGSISSELESGVTGLTGVLVIAIDTSWETSVAVLLSTNHGCVVDEVSGWVESGWSLGEVGDTLFTNVDSGSLSQDVVTSTGETVSSVKVWDESGVSTLVHDSFTGGTCCWAVVDILDTHIAGGDL